MTEASEFEQSLRGPLPRDRVAMIEDRDEAMYEKGYSAAIQALKRSLEAVPAAEREHP